MTERDPQLALFVYGTLKSDYPAHERFFGRDSKTIKSVGEAIVRGSLFALPAGYPALEVSKGDVLAVGTADPLSDARAQARIQPPAKPRPAPSSIVHGEVVRVADPASRLPALDEFEGFVFGGESLYQRALIPAWTTLDEQPLAVWAYIMDSPAGRRLASGVWQG